MKKNMGQLSLPDNVHLGVWMETKDNASVLSFEELLEFFPVPSKKAEWKKGIKKT